VIRFQLPVFSMQRMMSGWALGGGQCFTVSRKTFPKIFLGLNGVFSATCTSDHLPYVVDTK
jgi:peroxiredoxin